MTTKHEESLQSCSPRLLEVRLAGSPENDGMLHPGWVHATAILLRGLQRLKEGEAGAE